MNNKQLEKEVHDLKTFVETQITTFSNQIAEFKTLVESSQNSTMPEVNKTVLEQVESFTKDVSTKVSEISKTVDEIASQKSNKGFEKRLTDLEETIVKNTDADLTDDGAEAPDGLSFGERIEKIERVIFPHQFV